MFSALLIIVPLAAGLISFILRNRFFHRILMVGCSGIHLALISVVWMGGESSFCNGWFQLDALGLFVLTVISVLFFGASLYAVRYLSDEHHLAVQEARGPDGSFSESVFAGCFLLFLSTMTIVAVSQHQAVLWVGIEATTLATAPLIYFHRSKASLEATWKYLLICSVGIAMALLGIFFLAVATNSQGELLLISIIQNAGTIDQPWLKAAFLLVFVGYGTKMGLAPFHTWLPDAHSEAPSVVSALLSGALLNCAFLGILRVYQICIAAGLQSYCQEIFVLFGMVSIGLAAIFILGQTDYKRMLAYSSIEHMGILSLGIGLGAGAVFGVLINLLGHSLTKAGLFFIAGNILSTFKTKKIADVHGLMAGTNRAREFGVLWMVGFLLICGTPPSGIFLGKWMILKEALVQGRYALAAGLLSLLGIIFFGMARIYIFMTQGEPSDKFKMIGPARSIGRTWVPVLFFMMVISLGVYFPDWLTTVMDHVSQGLGGRIHG